MAEEHEGAIAARIREERVRKSLLFCEQKRSKKNVTPKPVWECRLKISLAVWLWM
jgi:hypothetical protein